MSCDVNFSLMNLVFSYRLGNTIVISDSVASKSVIDGTPFRVSFLTVSLFFYNHGFTLIQGADVLRFRILYVSSLS